MDLSHYLVSPVYTVTPSAFNCHETAFALWLTVWDLDLTSCMSCDTLQQHYMHQQRCLRHEGYMFLLLRSDSFNNE
ncbi:hypothetical protein Peur_031132 [Populus x canadensis]